MMHFNSQTILLPQLPRLSLSETRMTQLSSGWNYKIVVVRRQEERMRKHIHDDGLLVCAVNPQQATTTNNQGTAALLTDNNVLGFDTDGCISCILP